MSKCVSYQFNFSWGAWVVSGLSIASSTFWAKFLHSTWTYLERLTRLIYGTFIIIISSLQQQQKEKFGIMTILFLLNNLCFRFWTADMKSYTNNLRSIHSEESASSFFTQISVVSWIKSKQNKKLNNRDERQKKRTLA